MCKAGECSTYLESFDVAIQRRRTTVSCLSALLVISTLVGITLLLSIAFLGNLSATVFSEGLKAGVGLVISGLSVATGKEVLDRWAALGPLERVTARLRRCAALTTEELEATWTLAKEFSKKMG